MRRSTASVWAIPGHIESLARAVGELEPSEVAARIAVLEPFVTEARLGRMRGVIERRVGAVTVLLDSLHDPHNGAAIIRSSDAFGLARVHVIERRESFLTARTVARGSERWVDVSTHRTGSNAVAELAAAGFELFATHPEGELEPEALAELRTPFALVLGNERDGIADDLRAHTRRSVKVPMCGYAESLNVSVTAAILLYAATRGRPGDLPDRERDKLLLRGLIQTIPRAREVLDARRLPTTW
ncbi:MAG: RNA methyltransferase [Myxococcales bacterium]|nr:RNA methyltransferase [Myxococcales bacterium]